MALRTIRGADDEILKKISRVVDNIDEKLLLLIKDMADTMYKAEGAGLAAPQVGVLKRVVIIDVGEGLLKLINPVVLETEGSRTVAEGCLSIPGKWGRVIRPEKVTVTALDIEGKETVIKAEGELAKALCHEIDHLDGVLYTDKAIEMYDIH